MGVLEELTTQEPPEELFHYTTLTGLEGIIQSKKFWTTKIQLLNDSSEFSFTLNRMQELINTKIAEFPEQKDKLESLRNDINCIYKANIFVGSLSTAFDSLSQWRSYGNDEGSILIGFRGSRLKELAEQQNFFLTKCEYKEDEQEKIIQDLFEEARIGNLETIYDTLKKEKSKGSVVYNCKEGNEFWKKMAILAPIIKHPSFIAEQEWRLFSAYPADMRDIDLHLNKANSYYIPHIDIELGNDLKDIITRIVIGPHRNMEVMYYSLGAFLSKNDIDSTTILDTTKTTYRII